MITAFSLLVLHLAGLAAYVAWAVARLQADPAQPWWPYVVGAPLLYAALVLAITLTDFALAWWWRTPRTAGERIGAWRTLRMIGQEFVALLPSGLRMMAYPFARRRAAPAADALPVVLVHGVLCNGGVWNDVETACVACGIPSPRRLSYGPPLASIELFAEQLRALVDDTCRASGARRVVVVAHSMGGLVVRAYLARHGDERVAEVITLGTPWHGSRFAWLMAGRSLAQLRPGNAWLAALPALGAEPPFVALWSRHDSMVAPQASCELAGARNVTFLGRGHNALLHDREVIAFVVDELVRLRAAESATRRANDAGGSAAEVTPGQAARYGHAG